MTHLRMISLETAAESDLDWIDRISKFSYYEETYKDLITRGLRNELQFWRLVGEGLDGIIATRLIERLTLTELWIEFIAGKGLLSHAHAIHDDLWEVARRAGARRVSGIAQHRALDRVYQRVLGVRPVATIFSEEQPDG